MMKNISVAVLCLFLFSCSGSDQGKWKGSIEDVDGVTYVRNPEIGLWDEGENHKVSLVKELQIGRMDEGPEEYLFGFLWDIAFNSKGDIYAADRQLMEIRKFDKEGKYLATIGRKGQGPGEFQSVNMIAVGPDDELLVFDGGMGRIVRFSDSGEPLETTQKLILDGWISPMEIFAARNNYTLFGRLNGTVKLFHEYSKDWKLTQSYIDYEYIDNKDYEEQNLGLSPGKCVFQNSGDIVYVKDLYDNRIYFYKNQELVKVISRDFPNEKPYEVYAYKDFKEAQQKQREKELDFGSFGPGGNFIGNIYRSSEGLFLLADGKIAHFISVRKSKELREFGVELYDPEGKLLSYSNLGEDFYFSGMCKDDDDRFCVIDRKDYPKIVVFKLDY